MKAIRLSDTLAGLLARACTAAVVVATALDAQARLGPAEPPPAAAARAVR